MHFFEMNENIDPEILNANLREIEDIVSNAMAYNTALRKRHDISTLILNNLAIAGDYTNLQEVLNSYSSGVLHLPAWWLYNRSGSPSNFALAEGGLGLAWSEDGTKSLIATNRVNEFGENVPSASAVFEVDSSDTLVNPELIFSPNAVWAQQLSERDVQITGTFPPGLSNEFNYIRLISLVAGTSLSNQRFSAVNGTQYYPESYFDYQFILRSRGLGNGSTYLHPVGAVDIGFRNFYNSSTLNFDIDIPTDVTSLDALSASWLSNLNAQAIGQIADITVGEGTDAEAAAGNVIYQSAVDTYPLASSIAISDTNKLFFTITLKKYANSSPLLRGLNITMS